jgi:hypothetical protein
MARRSLGNKRQGRRRPVFFISLFASVVILIAVNWAARREGPVSVTAAFFGGLFGIMPVAVGCMMPAVGARC